jgi:arylsulfatase A-like enzyme
MGGNPKTNLPVKIIVLVVLLLLARLSVLYAAEPATRLNIVILLADQWRASATGYAGDPNVKTPALDRLAADGISFRNAVSACPVCTPYRATLMTGRWPTSTGMFLNDLYLPDHELCMAEILNRAGYATAYIGKWHLDGHGRDSYIPPERRQGWEISCRPCWGWRAWPFRPRLRAKTSRH